MGAPSTRQPASILFVEDHLDTCEVVARLLRKVGYLVSTATSVEEARTFCVAGKSFDVLISDIALPDGTGHQVLDCCRKTCSYSIALTGRAMPHEIRATMAAGFNDVLVKPVAFGSLISAVEKAMQKIEGSRGTATIKARKMAPPDGVQRLEGNQSPDDADGVRE